MEDRKKRESEWEKLREMGKRWTAELYDEQNAWVRSSWVEITSVSSNRSGCGNKVESGFASKTKGFLGSDGS